MNIKDEVEAVIFSISKKEPVVTVVLRMLGIKVTNEIPTAAVSTDGWLLINPEFWSGIEPENRVFLVVHEALHMIFDHLIRYRKAMDPLTFNIVADAKINDIAREITMEITGKDPGLYHVSVTYRTLKERFNIPENMAKKLTTEEIYELIKEESKTTGDGGKNNNRRTGNCKNNSGNQGNDGNDQRGGDKDRVDGGAGNNNDNRIGPENRNDSGNAQKHGDIRKATDIIDGGDFSGEVIRERDKNFNGIPPEEIAKKIKERVLAEAARQKLAGNSSALTREVLSELQLGRRIKWKNIIKEVISTFYKYRERTMRRPSRRTESKKVFYKGYIRKPQPNLIVFIDVSGSMNNEELLTGLSEVASFMKTMGGEVTIIQWDVGIVDISTYRGNIEFTRKGIGGTNFKTAWEELSKKYGDIVKKIKENVVLFISDVAFHDGENEYRQLVRKSGKFILLKTAKNREPEVYVGNKALYVLH